MAAEIRGHDVGERVGLAVLLDEIGKRLFDKGLVGLIGFLAGQLSASRQAEALQRQANARLVAAMAGLPSAASVTTYIRSKGGDLLIGPIKLKPLTAATLPALSLSPARCTLAHLPFLLRVMRLSKSNLEPPRERIWLRSHTQSTPSQGREPDQKAQRSKAAG